jgi:hypothetical protein
VAAVPRLIKFSGAVRDARGEPLGNVAVRLTFAVYSEQQGGGSLWVETQVVQLDEQGHYAVLLGATRADGLPVELFPAGKARWLGVQVEGRDEDSRVLLVSVPYALKAEDAAMLGGRSAADFVLGEQLKEEVRTQVAAQTPGIATQAVEMLVSNPPKAPAIAEGPSTFTCATTGDCVAVTQSGTGRALRTTATSASETVLVQQNGTGYGLRALSPGNVALLGQVTGSAGTSYGVKGQTTSTTGAGVFGYNLGATGLAYGVLGQTASADGTAFFGRATSTTGATIGLRGHADSTSGTGILGQATATSGTTTGIVGRVFSAAGTAMIVDNTQGGKLLSAQVNGAEKFGVSGSGNVVASGSVNSSGTLTGTRLISTVATGIAPVQVSSTTLVPNLYASRANVADAATAAYNADLVDGLHAAAFAPAAGSMAYVWKSGDTMTGALTLPANGLVAGTNQLVLSGGNVGIGVTAPVATLDVEGSSADQIVSVSQGGSGNGIAASTAASGAGKAAVVGTATGSSVAGVAGISTGNYAAGVFGTASGSDSVGGLFINTGGGDLIDAATCVMCTNLFSVDSAGGLYTFGNAIVGGGLSTNGDTQIGGDLNVNGTLSKAAGSFKIDHPLDPADKYLSHSFVESPDMMNIYNGVTRLDAKGEAWVSLPEWFEALNSDFRYQLTAIGRPQPRLYIAQEVSANRFKIAGGKSGAKVSWQVTGIRQDAYARAHRIRVEEEKPAAAKGFYLHPELFGQPKEKGIEWAHRPEQMQPSPKEQAALNK